MRFLLIGREDLIPRRLCAMNNRSLKAVGLEKIYPDGTLALTGVDVEISSGEVLVVLGPSGSGKSTLLNLLALLDRPTSGEVFWNGENIGLLNEFHAARLRNRSFGFVFQFFNLIPELTSLENIFLPRWFRDGKKSSISFLREKALSLMEELNLAHKASSYPNQLSGGEKQRVGICRSLICDPALIFADEPTGNLDSHAASEVIDLLCRLNREQGMSFVIATHNEKFLDIASKVVYLKDGTPDSECTASYQEKICR